MLVTPENIAEVCSKISQTGDYSLDTETTGLDVWKTSKLFSLIISDGVTPWYFNINTYPGVKPLPLELVRQHLEAPLSNANSVWYLHNAKFDMAAVLNTLGLSIAGTIHCTETGGRIERNDRFNYKLDTLAKAIGEEKDDAVAKFIKSKRLYREVTDENGDVEKVPCFDAVPFDIIVPYGEQDALVTHKLGRHQVKAIWDMQNKLPKNAPGGVKGPYDILTLEHKITKVCFEMEKNGVRVDRDFSKRALAHEHRRMQEAVEIFRKISGVAFVDSAQTLAPAFDKVGFQYPRTEKGNPSFRAEVLQEFDNPLAQAVLSYRNAQKRAQTYFANFIHYADANGYIHPNMRQSGTETGRMSYSNPNFQNLPKRKEKVTDEFNTRRAVIPSPGNCLVMLDYDQMEYRLMLEYARQMDVIEAVNSGIDVHQATADMMGVARDSAKTLNFMLLYGGGVAKLCAALFKPRLPVAVLKELVTKHLWKKTPKNPHLLQGLDPAVVAYDLEKLHQALALQETYFSKLPKIKEFTSKVTQKAFTRGQIRNWAGRICFFARKEFAYAAPNHLIQGGCADAMKHAMVGIHEFLTGRKTKLILQVHDELIFDAHPSELGIFEEIKNIMEAAYPHEFLKLTCGIDHSWKSWADKEEGAPLERKTSA